MIGRHCSDAIVDWRPGQEGRLRRFCEWRLGVWKAEVLYERMKVPIALILSLPISDSLGNDAW